jgi:hypothetical protein
VPTHRRRRRIACRRCRRSRATRCRHRVRAGEDVAAP